MSSNGNDKFDKSKFDRKNPLVFNGEKVVNKRNGTEAMIGTLIVEPPMPTHPHYDDFDKLDDYETLIFNIYKLMKELGWVIKKVICVDGKNWVDLEKFLLEIGNPPILGCHMEELELIERYDFDRLLEEYYENEVDVK